MFFLSRISFQARKPAVGFAVVCGLVAAGCSQVQMGYNVLSYDTAIADTANQQLLLNAVRASQHYPKSFTQPGEMKASPPVSGSIESAFNLARIEGLNTYSFTPKLEVGGGYTEFTLKNLNFEEYMIDIRSEIRDEITDTFRRNPNWPRQLRDLFYVQKFELPEQIVSLIDTRRKSICLRPVTDNQHQRCNILAKQIEEFRDRCEDSRSHFDHLPDRIDQFRKDPRIYYNTASNYCHYDRFRIFLEEVELARPKICSKPLQPGCVHVVQRTALDMIGYLGELIAAQNYISQPFVPRVMIGTPVGSKFEFIDVPLFEVRIGPPGPASVVVMHEGVPYYIPRPDFGSRNEARSMQSLDLVLQTVQAATKAVDVPKASQTVTTIPAKKG